VEQRLVHGVRVRAARRGDHQAVRISPGVAIPPAATTGPALLLFEGDHSKALSGSIRYTFGGFWSGSQQQRQSQRALSADVPDGVRPRPAGQRHLARAAEARVHDDARQPATGYSFSTNMFLDTLLQYRNDVKQFSANVRFNLIHRPLSDFFIVYNESQFTDITSRRRGLVVKYTQMFAF
jgi:hypothetical protein